MPPTSKWSIRLKENRAYAYRSGVLLRSKNLDYQHILNAEVADYKGKACVKLLFEPASNGKRSESCFNIEKYDWADSQGSFKEIVGVASEKLWVEKCNACLAELALTADSSQVANVNIDHDVVDECAPGTIDTGTILEEEVVNSGEKRKATEELIEQLTVPSKRKCNQKQQTDAENFQARIENCRIEGQFYVSVNLIEIPPKHRMLRDIDELFLSRLQISMEENRSGAYEPLFLNVKDVDNKDDFDSKSISGYKYEVLGGTHNFLATKALATKYPESNAFKGRYAWVFVGLSDEEALWVATRHNQTGSFRHEISFQEEVDVAYHQLQVLGTKNQDVEMMPNPAWRERCAMILGKNKKALTEIFAVASLPKNSYELFRTICKKYEKGKLKEQRALPKDMKGKPTFRPVYVRWLHGLDVPDRVELLKKVADGDISLDHLKVMAKEFKLIRPIQNTISSFIGQEWGIIAKKLPQYTSADQLLRFSGKQPTDCVFKSFLEQLRQKLCGSQAVQIPSPNTFTTDSRHQGIICRCDDPLDAEQSLCGRKDTGFSLAICTIRDIAEGENLESHLEKVFNLVERVNFATRQTYNIVILGSVEDVICAKGWVAVNRKSSLEIGYISGSNVKSSGSGDLRMVECIESVFLVYHAAVGDRLLPDHVSYTKQNRPSNLIEVDDTADHQYALLKRLVEMFSRQDDWILDINSTQGTAVAAAMESRRNGLCLVTLDDEEFVTKRRLSQYMKDK